MGKKDEDANKHGKKRTRKKERGRYFVFMTVTDGRRGLLDNWLMVEH